MKVLVTGGAGYIGSHAVKQLRKRGHQVTVLDNLSRGHRESVPSEVPFYQLDLRETSAVATLLAAEGIECVMHFAALTYVGESVEHPLRYYDNNTYGTLSLLSAMQQSGVERLVFSSTCATYGEPTAVPITEQEKQSPINPYGWSKLFVERILADHSRAQPQFGYCALRYFNVAGSAADGSIGEDHDPETHLIPVVLQAALGLREKVHVFGDDYDTPDGTCIRDYIHVEDLVDAHIAVMQRLAPGDTRFYNLGIGRGYSVKEVIDAARAVTGRSIQVEMAPRRAGDPPMLYASPEKARKELGWQAKITDLSAIIETAWRWLREHPRGYGSRAL
jgi:UDP-glucose-4-epimerase GalE